MRLQLRSSLVKPAKKVIGKQRLTVLVNVSFPAPCSDRPHHGVLSCQGSVPDAQYVGLMAEWLCTGLQIRLQRFDSA